MDKDLSDYQIQYAKGVGPKRAGLLSRIGIRTIKDLLYYLPYRYEDRSNIRNICELRIAHLETAKGRIISADIIRTRGRKFQIFEMVINDGTGLLKGKWFNQSYMKKNFSIGQEIILSGVVKRDVFWRGGPEMDNPEYEVITEDVDSHIHTKRIVPVYRVTEGISQRQFRQIMFNAVQVFAGQLSDHLPPEIMTGLQLPALREGIEQVHFPEGNILVDEINSGTSIFHRRLSFDELFIFELGVAVLKKGAQHKKGISFVCKGSLQKQLMQVLPFSLTNAQKMVLHDIMRDMKNPYPMNRLVQGDVGCGKTVVVLLAMLHAVECGYQAALMAPTEILAEQHYSYIKKMAGHSGLEIALLTGSVKDRQFDRIASGEVNIVIGTHALIQEGILFKRLGLAVIDEQHKFGVMQRSLLRKKGYNIDMLVMTATPIPRSLALTLYGDLDCSVIAELPPGRQRIITKLYSSRQKTEIYAILSEEIKKGRQAYIVYPIIDESDKISLKSAIQGKEAFEKIFPEFRIDLLHGRMSIDEREAVMTSFRSGEIDILICTTLIEVGVDVPNAALIIIIHAERFGLSQLHQLRGRVGRGAETSCCLLVAYEPYSEDAKQRLDIMIDSNDGFRIAEEDLNIRGPGEFMGTRQAGYPELKIANLVRDVKILEEAKKEAFSLIAADPELNNNPSLKKALDVFWKGKVDMFMTG